MRRHVTTTRRLPSIGWPARSVVGLTVRRSLRGPARTACCFSTRRRPPTRTSTRCALVGLVEQDWPERVRRSIFYPASLLAQLGWPNETDRLAAARARFHDLLAPARPAGVGLDLHARGRRDRVGLGVSSGARDERAADRALRTGRNRAARRVSRTRRCSRDPPRAAPRAEAAAWLALRASRSPEDDPAYHGAAGPRAPDAYAVSHVERYLECPFKYFAARVLRLDEERDDESGLSPQERGQLLHAVFRDVLRAVAGARRSGRSRPNRSPMRSSCSSRSPSRRSRICPRPIARSSATYLLGSAVAAGLGERAFNFEIEQEVPVLERLLEHPLEGTFEIQGRGRAADA